jgi:hypothetical protein
MKKKSHGLYRPRFRKNDHAHNVQASILRWVRHNGGTVVVGGGVVVADQGGYNYLVGMQCSGRRPKKTEPKP